MVFSSLLFIFIFLPVALLILCIGHKFVSEHKNIYYILLIFLSFLFYFWGSGNLLLLLGFSILFNWIIGNIIINVDSNKKIILSLGIILNLLLLFYFKYLRFFLDTLEIFSGKLYLPSLNPYLPVGISFYTFMSISYLVDVYYKPRQKATLLEFGAFLSLFPHLVAGPIVRFSELVGDLRARKSLSITKFYKGFIRFAEGLGMKVLIADNLAPTVDRIFSLDKHSLTFGASWLGAISYTFQIYFDFAGYSAMAIGLALMFGFMFPENFNRPYISSSITEFWRRWHITLSRWLKDYIYIPLGGNKKAISVRI